MPRERDARMRSLFDRRTDTRREPRHGYPRRSEFAQLDDKADGEASAEALLTFGEFCVVTSIE